MSARPRSIAHLHLHADLDDEGYEDVLDLLAGITPRVQPFPPDAVQLDLTGALRFFDLGPYALVQLVKLRLAALYGIRTTAGLAGNRMLAAMAAAATPPGGTTHVPGDQAAVDAWLRPRPVTALPGIGRATATTLGRFGLHTVADVADVAPATLQRLLGAAPARLLAERARGHDPRPVTPQPTALHLTADRILERDCLDSAEHHRAVLHLTEQLGIRLRGDHQAAGRLSLTVRYADRSSSTRTRTLPEATAHSPALAATALALLDSLGLQRARVRAYALRADQLRPQGEAHHQLTLDPDGDRGRAAEAASDRARKRFGADAVRPASLARHAGTQAAEDAHGRARRGKSSGR
ncbi:ImpB/MucB/SamB family protein [Streptomyces sp. V4-01]|uniref:ImpB/MucB/SamB family protein n=1 Tax=Actinacidiphila polyblastidii TaxID=3110430 RepID=A0ABU7PLB4_9ACTN|nr:ImpB/MucB/SamB family protein [Streptomyces sp. V4-01]